MVPGNETNEVDEMPACRFKALLSRMNTVGAQLEKEQMKRLPRAFRLVQAKSMLVRLQIEIERLAVRAVRVRLVANLGPAAFQSGRRWLHLASGSTAGKLYRPWHLPCSS